MALTDIDRKSWLDDPKIEDMVVDKNGKEYWKSCLILRVVGGYLHIDERFGPHITKSVEIFSNKDELSDFIDTLINIRDELQEE